jgi:hypothetical protein
MHVPVIKGTVSDDLVIQSNKNGLVDHRKETIGN